MPKILQNDKSAISQEWSILGPTLFLLYLPNDVTCGATIYADDTTLYSKCEQACDLLQQLELTSELESDLRHSVGWDRKFLVDFNAAKTQLVSFDQSALVLLMWKWMGLFLRRNHLLRCWIWLSLLNWIEALALSLLLKLPPRKLEPWMWSFFLLRLHFISMNLLYAHACNTVVTSGLVPLVVTWKCFISYRN